MTQNNGFIDLDADGKSIRFKALIHASMVMELNKTVIYVDPWGNTEMYNNLKKADFILLTDVHPDHYSKEHIEMLLTNDVKIIAPQAVYDLMPEYLRKNTRVMSNGEKIDLASKIMLEAVPMYNLPESDKAPHVKGRGNGYLLNVDGYRIYISGDTEDIPEMRSLEDIDLAFVCMNLPYTMSVENAIAGVKAFKPKMVCPYHYRNKDESLSDVENFSVQVEEDGITCILLDWYPD